MRRAAPPALRTALLKDVPPREIRGFPQRLADLPVTAGEVSPEWHVRVQAALQRHIDNAVSKTVNLPGDATVAQVDRTFRLAHELGCKGITVYRDACKEDQTLSSPRGCCGALAVKEHNPRPSPRRGLRRPRVPFGKACSCCVGHDGAG